MAINLSLFDGVPTKLSVAIEQFNKHKRNPRRYGISKSYGNGLFKSKGGFLVLKKLDKGKYKGYWSTFWYGTKPLKTKGIIKIWKIR